MLELDGVVIWASRRVIKKPTLSSGTISTMCQGVTCLSLGSLEKLSFGNSLRLRLWELPRDSFFPGCLLGFCSVCTRHLILQCVWIVVPKPKKILLNMSHVTCHMSHVMCNISPVTNANSHSRRTSSST